jgi:radical SAM protein (TIGR01212 family)
MQRYNSFGSYVKKKFGTPVHKVNIDAGFTCPNRDGTLGVSGCIYCNNDSFRPGSCRPTLSVREQVRNGIGYLGKRYGAERFIAYFQPYTNTYAPPEVLGRLYREALEEPSVVGLAIGTRPDCIDEEKLDIIEGISRTHFVIVEYGLQSIYEKSLRFMRRGHGLDMFLTAVRMTRERGIHAGAHIIVGFPTESREEMLEMAPFVSGSGVRFLKIHQLQVIKDTPLAEMYMGQPFRVFGYDDYLDFVVEFIERLSPQLVLQRLFATAPDEILIAPKWGKSRSEILRDIERRLEEKGSFQGVLFSPEVRRLNHAVRE